VANNRASSPVVINAQNNATYMQPNANYTMTGDELYVNSGWIWPESQIPPGLPPITPFSVTFANAGTYDYVCIIHLWMVGQIVVQYMKVVEINSFYFFFFAFYLLMFHVDERAGLEQSKV
jgi:hypothetical protein